METVRVFFLARSQEIKVTRNTKRKKVEILFKNLISLTRLTVNMENDEEYEYLPSEFYYPEERLHENSNETSVQASRQPKVYVAKTERCPVKF